MFRHQVSEISTGLTWLTSGLVFGDATGGPMVCIHHNGLISFSLSLKLPDVRLNL